MLGYTSIFTVKIDYIGFKSLASRFHAQIVLRFISPLHYLYICVFLSKDNDYIRYSDFSSNTIC